MLVDHPTRLALRADNTRHQICAQIANIQGVEPAVKAGDASRILTKNLAF